MATAKSIPIPELTQAQQERFWSHVLKADGDACWLWQASGQRYGKIKYSGRFYSSHRMAYHLAHGPIPDGLLVCHKCDNQKCCRPDHLFAGTNADNQQDMLAKGRENRACGINHGSKTMPHKFDGSQNRKLTAESVAEIRRRYALGGVTQQQLADEYLVSQVNISVVLKYKTWRRFT